MTENQGHMAAVTPEDGGYLVTCPHGCRLGTSAHAPDEDMAARRVRLHELATRPLVPYVTE